MVILKKIVAATLLETLIATGLILLVFVYGSLCFNSIFTSNIKKNDLALKYRLAELTYLVKNNKIQMPFYEDTNEWKIEILKQENSFHISTLHKPSNNQTISKFESP